METKILKSLLAVDFFTANKSSLSPKLFEEELRDIYNCIAEGHTNYAHDLTIDDVEAIWIKNNPVATRPEKEAFSDLFKVIQKKSHY